MKKSIFAALVFFGASSAFAVPANTDALIKGLVKSEAFNNLIQSEQNLGQIAISRVENFKDDSDIEKLCENKDLSSRSASVMKVEVFYAGGVAAVVSSTHYFVTPEQPEDLKKCDGSLE